MPQALWHFFIGYQYTHYELGTYTDHADKSVAFYWRQYVMSMFKDKLAEQKLLQYVLEKQQRTSMYLKSTEQEETETALVGDIWCENAVAISAKEFDMLL